MVGDKSIETRLNKAVGVASTDDVLLAENRLRECLKFLVYEINFSASSPVFFEWLTSKRHVLGGTKNDASIAYLGL